RLSAKLRIALSEILASSPCRLNIDGVAIDLARLAPTSPSPAAAALRMNTDRSAAFSALRRISSFTYLCPNIRVPSRVGPHRWSRELDDDGGKIHRCSHVA